MAKVASTNEMFWNTGAEEYDEDLAAKQFKIR
jgi:hypothetical protein